MKRRLTDLIPQPRTPEDYQVRLEHHEDEIAPLVGWLWAVAIMVVLLGLLWEGALRPLLQHLGIHI
jgi:hypothetical protein